jgi:hypothetical protein
MFRPDLGFLTLGFDLFRRLHRPGLLLAFDFAGQTEGTLPTDVDIGPFHYTNNGPGLTGEFLFQPSDQGSVLVMQPGQYVTTCRFNSTEAPVRRIEIDFLHWYDGGPASLSFWGISNNYRVTGTSVDISSQNVGQTLTAVLTADALHGFQLGAAYGEWMPQYEAYGLLRVRWTRCSSESLLDWGNPLNRSRIGLPVTAPGYQVPTDYGQDPGNGELDWKAAGDRLSPTGSFRDLPPELKRRFGFPGFANIRDLMQKALANQPLQQPAANGKPALSLDPVQMLLLAALDPDAARMLGLALTDDSVLVDAELGGEHYDYKIVGYSAGPLRRELDCAVVPGAGSTIGTSGPISMVTSAGSRISIAAVDEESREPLNLKLAPGLELPREVDVEKVRGIVIRGNNGRSPSRSNVRKENGEGSNRANAGRDVSLPSSAMVNLEKAVGRVGITGASAGPQPFTAMALAGDTVVAVASAAPGGTANLILQAEGITSVIVTAPGLRIDAVCRIREVQEVLTYQWICFDLTIGVLPALNFPRGLSAQTMPGFATAGGSEQVIGIKVEPRPVPTPPWTLFPLVRVSLDPVAYDISRRADGDQPLRDAGAGNWTLISVDPTTNEPQPVLNNSFRPLLHQSPEDWPIAMPDWIDGALDANVRYYSYRARSRDLFGRISDWSDPVSVDAADRVAPPAPVVLRANWIEAGDSRSTMDDSALLQAAETDSAVRLRWSWPQNLRDQAPDVQSFRVYWNSGPFTSLLGTIIRVHSFGSEHGVNVALGNVIHFPPIDAFAGDWLRQAGRQYLILGSDGRNPVTLRVSGVANPPPVTGECTVSLRAPNVQRLDLLGNPMRRDASRAEVWDSRVQQGPMVTAQGNVSNQMRGVAVRIRQVFPEQPRPGAATLDLAPDWQWSDIDATSLTLTKGGASYSLVAGTLGRAAAVVVIDTLHDPAPSPGPATLADDADHLVTLVTDLASANFPDPHPYFVVGGTATLAQPLPPARRILQVRVVAHQLADTLQLAVLATGQSTRFIWFPDYEAFLTDLNLPVSDTRPRATAIVGVSAVDKRAYIADRRGVAGEPIGPGNEGPVGYMSVQRSYHGVPAAQPAPDGVIGPDPIWAPVPGPFSGISRYPLRWHAGGVSRFLVLHATLDAVLDADQLDRANRRSSYVGLPELTDDQLVQWRARQAVLDAQGLRALATAQRVAFVPITPTPLNASDPLLSDAQGGDWLRYVAALDGQAPGGHFLRLAAVDAAGNVGTPGEATLPIVVPDVRRPPAPLLRRVIDGDRSIWLQWDAAARDVSGYQIFRSQLPAGSRPDVRDMARLAVVPQDQCPQPLPVFGGSVRLPGAIPDSLLAAYRAEEYNPALAPDRQVSHAIPGNFRLAGTIADGFDLPDGSLVFLVVRLALGGPASLAVSSTARSFRDTTQAGIPLQYRIVAVRQAQVGQNSTLAVSSFPSEVGEGTSFSLEIPVPPQGNAAWQSAMSAVRITWNPANLPPGLQIMVQRKDVESDSWDRAVGWQSASQGSANDVGVLSGHQYQYRFRVRIGLGSSSQDEPVFASVAVP